MAIVKRKPNKRALISSLESGQLTTAEKLISEAKENYKLSFPLDVESIASSLGINVTSQIMDDEISGHLTEKDDQWEICVNSLHHPRRQRFTVAHELGHFILHRDKKHHFIDERLFRNGASEPIETEANSFAAELLMPEDEFRAFIKTTSNKVEDIAEHFGVSALAVRIRAKILNFKGHGL